MKYIEIGNTEVAANKMKAMLDADLFKIEMKTPYAKDYQTCIEEAKDRGALRRRHGGPRHARQGRTLLPPHRRTAQTVRRMASDIRRGMTATSVWTIKLQAEVFFFINLSSI